MFARGSTRSAGSARQQDFEFYAFKKKPEQMAKAESQQPPPAFFNDDSIFELDRLIQLFAMCDADNDDFVTRADFVRVSHEIGGLPPSLVCQLDRVLPPNQPGLRVSLHELVTMARNFAAAAAASSLPLQPANLNAGSSPVKLKRYENSQGAPPTPNSTPDRHHQQFVDLQRQAKYSTCSPTPLPPPPSSAAAAHHQQQLQQGEMPEINQSVIGRLQREKESLEAKLGGMLQMQHHYGGGCEDQIATLQALIAKYHQQICVAAELQKQKKSQRTPPPVAPKPPTRRSLPVIQQVSHEQQQPAALRQIQSQSRLVTQQVTSPPCGYGLEQIDELSHPESGDDKSAARDSSSDSSLSSSDSDEERRDHRRHRHSKPHYRHRQSSSRSSNLAQNQPPPPPPHPHPQQKPAGQAELINSFCQQTVPTPSTADRMLPQGFALDIEAVDSAFQQQEQLVSHLKQQLLSCMTDRDRYKKLAQDFYRRIQYQKSDADISCSPTTPMMESQARHSAQLPSTPSTSRLAEVRQLPRLSSASPMLNGEHCSNVTAADLSVNQGSLSTAVAEHLVEETEHAAVIQELVQSLAASGCRIPPEKLQEFAAELECRSSKADRLRAAADLLASSLSKQRQHAANLATALARSEESQASLRMALDCAMQKAEAVQALLKLSESEQLLLLAHCRAVGMVRDDQHVPFDQDQHTVLLGEAVSARRQAELEAQRLLSRLDNSCGISGTSSAVCGELGLLSSNNSNSSPRATGTCSSTSSRNTEPEEAASTGVGSTSSSWTSLDEQRLREYAVQLDRDVQAMQMTINDPVLESAAVAAVVGSSGTVQSQQSNNLINTSMLDSPLPLSSVGTTGSGSTKDSLFGGQSSQHLETAVLVQELATLKEQRAESRTQCFILEREKRALETELRARDQQATVLKVHLDQTRLELEDASSKVRRLEEAVQNGGKEGSSVAGSELEQALQRERRLRVRIQELVDTLEMVGRSAEKQLCDGGVDLISELRKANSTLSESYERARKKQDQRIKRLETQLGAVTSRYETKVSLLKKQVALLEETSIGSAIDGPSFAPEAHL